MRSLIMLIPHTDSTVSEVGKEALKCFFVLKLLPFNPFTVHKMTETI